MSTTDRVAEAASLADAVLEAEAERQAAQEQAEVLFADDLLLGVGDEQLTLSATSSVVRAGGRLRLDVSSSEFPTFELNPNTGNRITHSSETESATQQIFHDERRPSRLILPVIP